MVLSGIRLNFFAISVRKRGREAFRLPGPGIVWNLHPYPEDAELYICTTSSFGFRQGVTLFTWSTGPSPS